MYSLEPKEHFFGVISYHGPNGNHDMIFWPLASPQMSFVGKLGLTYTFMHSALSMHGKIGGRSAPVPPYCSHAHHSTPKPLWTHIWSKKGLLAGPMGSHHGSKKWNIFNISRNGATTTYIHRNFPIIAPAVWWYCNFRNWDPKFRQLWAMAARSGKF